jgi:hypothetical protein
MHTIGSTVPDYYVLQGSVLGLKIDGELALAQLQPGSHLRLVGDPADSGIVRVRTECGATYRVFYSDLLQRSRCCP